LTHPRHTLDSPSITLGSPLTHPCLKATAEWEEDRHRKWLLGEVGPVTDEAKKCHLLQLDSGGFVKYLKKVPFAVLFFRASKCATTRVPELR